MADMERTLLLKRLVAVDGVRYPTISPLNTHGALKEVFAKATTVGDRHFPAQDKVKPGKRCVFLEPVARDGSSVLLHAYVYTAGHTPDQVITDFDATTADIKAEPIMVNGEHVEVVERFACLVLGDALIIENARVAGAADIAVAAIKDLIRRHHNSKFPRLLLEDAPNRGLKHLAAIHGGVVKLVARVNKNFTPEPTSFGKTLDSLFGTKTKLSKYKQVTATIEADADDPLDPDEVLKIVDESEAGTGLSSVSVSFADTTTLSDLDSYRERHRVTVQQVRPGVPAVTEIETEMVEYLKALITPDVLSSIQN